MFEDQLAELLDVIRLQLLDVDLDAANQVRDTIAVLQNRSQFAQSDRAQSLG